MAADLVCGMVVDPASAPARTTYAGSQYSFCAAYCRAVFEKDPEKFIQDSKQWGEAVDPVCGMSVQIPLAAAMSVHRGQFIYFCSEACKKRFDASPEKYFNTGQDMARPELNPGPGRVAAGLKKVEFPVSGMSCASCVARIEKGLSKMNGIADVKVNFASEKAFVTLDPTQVHLGDLIATVKDLGYAAGMEKVTLPVHGMSCASCVKKVESALNGLEGVLKASVNFATERATVQYVPGAVSVEDFKKAVKDAGYEILETGRVEKEDVVDREQAAREAEFQKLRVRFISGLVLVIPVFLLAYWSTLGLDRLYNLSRETGFFLQLLFQTPIQFWVGWRFYVGAWKSAKHKSADMNTLIAVGTSAAYLYSVAGDVLSASLFGPGVGGRSLFRYGRGHYRAHPAGQAPGGTRQRADIGGDQEADRSSSQNGPGRPGWPRDGYSRRGGRNWGSRGRAAGREDPRGRDRERRAFRGGRIHGHRRIHAGGKTDR